MPLIPPPVMQEAGTEASESWQEISRRKREALAASIPPQWRIADDLVPPQSQLDVTSWPASSGWFTDDELAITELSATQLAAQLCSGQLKSEVVTRAFCKRAAAAQQLTNCLAEIVFDRALATARARDAHLEETGKPLGPLHGLPVSIKDNFKLCGVDSTIGFVSHVGDAATSQSTLVTLLEQAGAVIYVKTNVPTAMMIPETVNNLFGRTCNPRNRETTSGGSSGGEAALITLCGSPLGVGTDIGGSIRVPAACTGIFGLRPSFGRFPTRNCRSGMPGQETVRSVNGPLARSLADIELFCKSVIGQEPWRHDTRCLPIPWRQVEAPQRLRIAVLYHDGLVLPTPPVTRALKETVKKLQAAGHDIVEWDPVYNQLSGPLLMRMFVSDGGKTIRQELERTGEPWPLGLEAYRVAKELGTYDLWKLHADRVELSDKVLDCWNKAQIDAILSPTTAYSSAKHDTLLHVVYTGIFNVLDYSTMSFPTGHVVDKNIDILDKDYQPLSPTCKMVNENYDAAHVDGLPISLQLAAQRLQEEKLLAMTQCVLEALSLP
ncbi:hypothetical protein CDD82_291 [Ophiocordyceps australis]|uniref:Amidase domain-containing protein n=1 Tax=Ophiocordyceps australis TaxID=1399860 RepID=A0A2C5YMD2_9HYPO|nr:hypothetical protein CDD82_291 [Ophiocordyceps australis]